MRGLWLGGVALGAVAFLLGYWLGGQRPAAAGTAAGPASPTPAAPVEGARIRLLEESFDFGTVSQGEKVVHTFAFANEGTGPLQIEEVTTSCGCTATMLSNATVEPGGRGEVRAEFDSTTFSERVQIRINLFTNDPQKQVATAFLEGTVDAALQVTPANLELEPVREGGEVKGVFRIASGVGHGDFRVVGASASSDRVRMGTPRRATPVAGREDAAWEVPVTAFGRAPYGAVWDRVTVETDHPRQKRLELKVTRTVAERAGK